MKCVKIWKKWGATYSDTPYQEEIVLVPLELLKLKYFLESSIRIKSFYVPMCDDKLRSILLIK